MVLQGDLADPPAELFLQVCAMDPLQSASQSAPLPIEVQKLLVQFSYLFQPPYSLLPSRSCNHIPLILGAQPFYIRPYRYPPTLKKEIECQV